MGERGGGGGGGRGGGGGGGSHMQLGKLGADDCNQQVECKVGANDDEAEVVEDHHAADAIQ